MKSREYILITGANSDLGRSSAKILSDKYLLILSGRNFQELENIKSELNNSDSHLIWSVNLLEENLNEKLINFIETNKIHISGFIHFAGYFKVTPLRLVKQCEVFDSYKINVLSAIQISSVLAKKKYKKQLKNIILVSSISALRGKSGFSVYASAKSALNGLTKNLAIELAPVSVNQLTLGAVYTKKTQKMLAPIKEDLDNHIPLKLGTVNQITRWVNFFIDNDDKWVTGQEFVIDGGATVL